MVALWMHMNMTIKNLPLRLHRNLKSQARLNKRILNWEVIDILDRSLGNKPVEVEALLAQAQRMQDRLRLAPLTEDVLREAKGKGRP
jgi:hypothetical protein